MKLPGSNSDAATRDLRLAFATAALVFAAAIGLPLLFGQISGCVGDSRGAGGVEEVRPLYSFPHGGSGSDSIAEGGLWQGATLYDITLSSKAHLVVLYDNTTSSVSMVPWPDPTSPETGYLYVSPLDRDAVLRRIRDREDKDERAKAGENVYSYRMTGQSQETTATDGTVTTEGTIDEGV